MNAHDITETRDDAVVCACGRVFTGNRVTARVAHERHWGVEQARAALNKEKTS